MSRTSIHFQDVSFTYDAMSAPLLAGLTVDFSADWTGVVGANGVGKTTILRLATRELEPQQGSVHAPVNAIYCAQRTDAPPGMLVELTEATDGNACEIKGRIGLDHDWPNRWDTLSHGERKRAQIAVALWRRPQVLAVDEPTNHLDMEARDLLAAALHSFRGIGLLVSHDRGLLDTLCRECLFVDPPKAVIRPGGVTKGSQQALRDEEYVREEYEHARRKQKKLEKEAAKRRELASLSHRLRSKRGIPIKDHDARGKINRARLSGKDGQAGRLLNQLEGRLARAAEEKSRIKVKKTYELGIWLPGARSRSNALFSLSPGSIPLGGDRQLEVSALTMRPDDRIALTGPNGSGKSTLVSRIVNSLSLPMERLTYIPQEIDLQSSQGIMDRARNLPKDRLGRMMAVVSRLGSQPRRLLESSEPSPGEVRKVLLATGIANTPHLIIMDEPTNHLDLPSIECLETALADCPCGLLLVSHDPRFLDRLTTIRWRIGREQDAGPSAFTLRTSSC